MADTQMALRKIVERGDPCLNKVCRPVTAFNSRLHILLDDMLETLEQAAYLRAQGCVMGQGYLFGRPIAASRVPLVLAHQERDAALADIRVGP